ncbi:MAG TPA: site-specific integrase [Blastocatellia bacterium]|nr:site-specific integrase [Blastocatellia bacterium]
MAVKKRGLTWYHDFSVRGVRYRGAIPEARTKYQAEQAESRVRDRVFEGKYGQMNSKMRFAEFAEDVYLPWAESSKRSGKHEKWLVSNLIGFFGSMTLGSIDQIAIERFKRERLGSTVKGGRLRKPASINRELSCLSKILSLARDNNYLREKSRIKLLREDNCRIRYLTAEEESRLMESLKHSRTYLNPIVIVALNTGMRLKEITGLRWRQVDFLRNRILVTNTKNGRDRTIPMNALTRKVLERLHNGCREQVFESLPNISIAFNKACKKAGIEDFRFHDLRHTFGTRLADAGVDVVTIAALMGHSSIQMAMRYTHPTEDRNRRAVDALLRYSDPTEDRNRKAVEALSGYGQKARQIYVTREVQEDERSIA